MDNRLIVNIAEIDQFYEEDEEDDEPEEIVEIEETQMEGNYDDGFSVMELGPDK